MNLLRQTGDLQEAGAPFEQPPVEFRGLQVGGDPDEQHGGPSRQLLRSFASPPGWPPRTDAPSAAGSRHAGGRAGVTARPTGTGRSLSDPHDPVHAQAVVLLEEAHQATPPSG